MNKIDINKLRLKVRRLISGLCPHCGRCLKLSSREKEALKEIRNKVDE